MLIGSDTGGTFTDLVTDDGRVVKVPSTPDDPGRALRAGLGQLGAAEPIERLTHGTTIATNALLERRGATVALVTNAGMADIIEIGRQDRPSLYDPTVDRPEPLVARAHRYEVTGRLDATGAELEPIEPDGLGELDPEVEAVAVVLLHADLNPVHEQAVADRLASQGHDVSVSHQVSPEFREYERTVTTVANAYLRPACRGYLEGLAGLAHQVGIMTSAGGLVPVAAAVERPVDLVLSGPAGGVAAAAAVAVANGWPDAVTFDMGGTSTDVCLVLSGRASAAAERVVGGFALRVASLDVHTIGAGGGSIAAIDAGGALTVGPSSAGAVPGPACYGRGGTDPTVTDADLVAGRLPAGIALPGLGVLDVEASRAALVRAGVDAAGVIAVVEAAMTQALRAVTVERGVDPRRLALVAFGGAGPLHACGLADALGMPAVVVPARAGVLSAAGILVAPDQRDLVRSWPTPGDHRSLDDAVVELGRAVRQALGDLGEADDVVVETSVDCRYQGQSHELSVPTLADFPAEHRRRNGYARSDAPIEVIAIRARARRRSPRSLSDLPAPGRTPGVGPVAIVEPDCTIWVPEGWRGRRRSRRRAGAHTGDRVTLSPASLQILISRLSGVAEEMSAVLRRSAYSPNIKERADCSAAVFDPAGQLLAQAENIPVHLGSMPASVRAAIDRFGDRSNRTCRSSSTTPTPGAPTSTTSPWWRLPTPGGIWWVGWPPGPTMRMWVATRPGRCPRMPPTSPRRACAWPLSASPPRSASWSWPRRAHPPSGRATWTPRWGPTQWASSGWPPWTASPSPRSWPTASAACGPCWPPCPTAHGASPTSSTASGRVPTSRSRRSSPWPSVWPARR